MQMCVYLYTSMHKRCKGNMVLNHTTTGIECFATVICMIDALQLAMHVINMIVIHLKLLNFLWHPYTDYNEY